VPKFVVAMVDYDYDSLEPIAAEIEQRGGLFQHRHCPDIETAIAWAAHVDGWIVQRLSPIGEKVFRACPNLKVVGRIGIGVEGVDIEAATRHNIIVTNVPAGCVDEVSEHAMALLLTCARRTTVYNTAVKRGVWNWKLGGAIRPLRGQVLGLVGFGKIGAKVAEKAAAFGMIVIATDPCLKDRDIKNVKMVTLDELLGCADVVSIHCPLTRETKGLFGELAFARMKPSAILINTARGGIVDMSALVKALRRRQIAGAGLDVLPEEPPRLPEPLFDFDNVVLSPHTAWYSESSIMALQTTIARGVALACLGQRPDAIVNPEVVH